jgi:hypothetical protein
MRRSRHSRRPAEDRRGDLIGLGVGDGPGRRPELVAVPDRVRLYFGPIVWFFHRRYDFPEVT